MNPAENPPTIINRGNQTAHQYTIGKARMYAKTPALIDMVNIISRGVPETCTIMEVSEEAWRRLLMIYPSLIQD